MFLLAGLVLVLVGFDGYISYRRIRQYGPFAEVNLLVRQVIQDFGLKAGISVGALQNLLVVAGMVYWHLTGVLVFFAGVKFGLTLMQLKSLQMETYIEKVLVKARARKRENP